jgi:hypothetical protein
MPRLFKYISSRYTATTLYRGELLFRNLTYFRQQEGKVRGDPYEGIHKDHPGTEQVISNLTRSIELRGPFSFLHSTDSDLIFAYCLSNRLGADLASAFSADTVIEITDSVELVRRISFTLRRVLSVHKAGVLARDVYYYRPDEPALFDVEEPKNLAFVKNRQYIEQDEFRIAFGTRRAFQLTRQIAQPHHDPYEEAMTKKAANRLVRIGAINDIARIVTTPA